MEPVLSAAEARAFDRKMIDEAHVPSLLLMENAARGAADLITQVVLHPASARARACVVIVAGTGNNGADGVALARHLLTRGLRVSVRLVGEEAKATPDARVQLKAWRQLGGEVVAESNLAGSTAALAGALTGADVVVDALFGTGLSRPLEGDARAAVAALNEAAGRGQLVVALDVPSGLSSDTAQGECVQAARTVTFGHLKQAHTTSRGREKSGLVSVVNLGVPPLTVNDADALDAKVGGPLGCRAARYERRDAGALLTARPIDSHKYTAGHVLVVGGAPGKVGAAVMSSEAAVRAGAGSITVATWPEVAPQIIAARPELMTVTLDEKLSALGPLLEKCGALVLGPGLGLDDKAKAVVRALVGHGTFRRPVVLDADAIATFAGEPESLRALVQERDPARFVLTPHAGELARLLGKKSADIEADRFAAAREGAARTGCHVVLKGPYSLLADPAGRVVVNIRGSAALGTAGSGDVLAGIVAALATHASAAAAAACGMYLHARAGEVWEERHADRGALALDLANLIPEMVRSCARGNAPESTATHRGVSPS